MIRRGHSERERERGAESWLRFKLREEQQQKNNAHGSPLQPGGSSAFSRCLREKGLNLLLHFSAVAAGALTPFFVVLADCHCEGETLNTLFAKIFVKRHRDPPLGFLAS
jgi:hypothetical protein